VGEEASDKIGLGAPVLHKGRGRNCAGKVAAGAVGVNVKAGEHVLAAPRNHV
jgi:hypothetical protein